MNENFEIICGVSPQNKEDLNESILSQIIKGNGDKLLKNKNGRVILYGTNKKKIKAHTLNQIKILDQLL